MAPKFLSLATALREELAAIEPALWSGTQCAAFVEAIASTEKACGAARARLAARAVDCGAHRGRGFRDPEDWLGRVSGSSAPKARADLGTARRLQDCPRTKQAVAEGTLSMEEASEITRTEEACPGSEDELVERAKAGGLGPLRDEARRLRAAAADPEERRRRQVAARAVRLFTDDLGMVQVRGALLPEVGVALSNRLEAAVDRLRRKAKAEGRDEAREAHAHDALAQMLEEGGAGAGTGGKRGSRADCVFVVDLGAFRRGHAHDGEACHLMGSGPLPVWLLKDLAQDAFLKVVLHDGVAIHTVCHLGRHIPAHLRTALELGEPPGFGGVTCSVSGCGRRHGLEWDHEDPVAHAGPTSFENLDPKCWGHHQDKTAQDRRAGLLDGVLKRLEDRAPP